MYPYDHTPIKGIAVQKLLTILNKWTLTQFSFHHGVYSYPHIFPDTITTYKSTPSATGGHQTTMDKNEFTFFAYLRSVGVIWGIFGHMGGGSGSFRIVWAIFGL